MFLRWVSSDFFKVRVRCVQGVSTPQTKSAEDLDEIFEDEARHIRKVVLCVLPKEFCVRRSEKDPMILRISFLKILQFN